MLRLQNSGRECKAVYSLDLEEHLKRFRNVTVLIIGYLHLNMVSCSYSHSTFKDRYLSNDSRVVTKRKERSPPTFNIAFKVTLRGAEEGKKNPKEFAFEKTSTSH